MRRFNRSSLAIVQSTKACLTTAITLVSLSACGFAPTERDVQPAPVLSSTSDGFTNFETEPVRPVALSPDGRYLYVLNTADDRLEIFDASGDNLRSIGETTVGLPAGARAARGRGIT